MVLLTVNGLNIDGITTESMVNVTQTNNFSEIIKKTMEKKWQKT
jgi:hypothetical protein